MRLYPEFSFLKLVLKSIILPDSGLFQKKEKEYRKPCRRIYPGFLTVLFIFVLISALPVIAQFNPQSSAITEKFFPEPEFDIHTPAFEKTSGFTNYKEMMDWLNKTIGPHKETVRLSFIGTSQKGKPIPMLVVTKPNGNKKTKVWLQGGLHGDEPAGTEGLLFLLDKLLNDPSKANFLENLEIAFVPMANIDGYEAQTRYAANGSDLNRDQTRLKEMESISLKTAFSNFKPSVAVDFHEYRPFRKDFTRFGKAGISSRYDAMFLFTGNLNVPKVLRDFTDTVFVENARKTLAQNGLCYYNYMSPQKYGGQVQFNLGSVHSRSSASSYALSNCVSTLLEIRGVGIGRTSFKRRVKSTFLVALSYLETANGKREELARVLAESAKGNPKVVAISSRKVRKDSVRVIDLASKEETRIQVTLNDALQSSPVLQRDRPFAYLLLPTEKMAAFRLKVLGIQVDSLTEEKELEVEAYQLEAAEEEEQKEEEEETDGSSASAKTRAAKVKFPVGTYVVYYQQDRGNLAGEVLEPENANGFVSMKVIRTAGRQEIPIYRYIKSEKITQ